MTPVSHSVFGFAAGFILSGITAKAKLSRRRTVILCTAGAVLPDLDAVWLVLDKEIYYGLKWFSHHAVLHSIFGVAIIALIAAILFQPKLTFHAKDSRQAFIKWMASFFVLFSGGLLHLPCDMITLPGVWEGLPIFAPFSWDRFGGWAHMPWRDFYFICFSLCTYFVFSLIWLCEYLFKKKTIIIPILAALMLSYSTYYFYNSRFTSTIAWENNQKELVGEDIYFFAKKFEKQIFRLWNMKTIF